MENGYSILYEFGRFFIGKRMPVEGLNTYFIGHTHKGFYTSLCLEDFKLYKRHRTNFWKMLLK